MGKNILVGFAEHDFTFNGERTKFVNLFFEYPEVDGVTGKAVEKIYNPFDFEKGDYLYSIEGDLIIGAEYEFIKRSKGFGRKEQTVLSGIKLVNGKGKASAPFTA